MARRVRFVRCGAAVAAALVLSVAAVGCGGGSGGDDGAGSTVPGVDTGTDTGGDPGDITVPGFEPEPASFVEVDGSQARFLNLLVVDGEGVGVDAYWGTDAERGELAATVAYGEVSDWMPIKVDEDPLMTGTDGEQSVAVAFYPEGETAFDQVLSQSSQNIEGDVSYTYTVGWTKQFDSSTSPASIGIGYEHRAGEAPDGQAWVAFNTGGIGGIEGGDFMTLDLAGECNGLTSVDVGETANSGAAYAFDPGTVELTASDANSECANPTDPISLDLEAGDRYVVFAYGTTLEDRQLMALKVDG